jgi:pimeloyl-ACP methyl ester carboxylesterase
VITGFSRAALRAVLAAGLGIVLAFGGVAATATPAQAAPTTPSEDPFYTPPSPLPPGGPGTIIRSRQARFALDSSVNSWQVLYKSESATGASIAVSGTVLVPGSAWTGPGPRPLVSWGVGTRGVGDACAPSHTLSNGLDYEILFVQEALRRGWAVAVTDMEGLGTPGQHTYEVGRSQGKAMLDIARAAQRLSGTGLGGTTPVGLFGYSQGGTTVGWAAELAPTYAPGLAIKGAAAGGVPADLIAVARYLDGGVGTGLALLAALGYDAAYPELDLERFLNDRGRELMADAQNVCLVSFNGFTTLLGTAFTRISDYTTSDPLATEEWQRRLNENKLGSNAPAVPVFMGHAVFDELIPIAQANRLRRDWCARGVNVTWRTYLLAEHALGMVWTQPDAMRFLSDRFAGRQTSGNC